MTFGEKFRELHDKQKPKATYDDYGFTGVQKSTVYRWAKGDAWPNLKQVQQLAEHFGVPVAYLADDAITTVGQAIPVELTEEERQYVEIGRALGMESAAPLMVLVRRLMLVDGMVFMEVLRRLLNEPEKGRSPGNPGPDRGQADLRVHARGEGGSKTGADHKPKPGRH